VRRAAQRRKGRSKPDGSGPRVIAPQVDQAYGKSEQPPTSQLETNVLQFLAVFFAAIMVEGVFLAVSVRMISMHGFCVLLQAMTEEVYSVSVQPELRVYFGILIAVHL